MNLTAYNVLESVKTVEGNDISLCGLSSREGQILIIGVFHGDEPQGEELINRYMAGSNKSNLLFIPCLNPDGKLKSQRGNSHGIDLNRNFPTRNWEWSEHGQYYGGVEAGSEIETKFVIDVLDKYKPSAVITLHTPYKIVNYDGPAQNLAGMISEITGYPVEPNIGYPTPGSFGTYAGVERNIPTITLEMDEYATIEKLYGFIEKIFDRL